MDKDTWDAITAIGTVAAAVATAVMASLTWKAITEGQGQRKETNDHFAETRKQDKQHHEDSFRPLLVLSPNSARNASDRQDILHVHQYLETVMLDCLLRNIGTGPALNVQLNVRSEGRTGFGPSRELTPMAAGDAFKDQDGYIRIDLVLTNTFNSQDLHCLPSGLWLIVLEYEDVFGNSFHTIHAKEQGIPWTRVGRGKAPDTTPRQEVNAISFSSPASFKAFDEDPAPPHL